MDLNFRELQASEIECRVSTVNENGCSLLLYKDARVDQRLLDEHVGPMNWQRKHEIIGGSLYCSVGIYDTDKAEWIWKQDVGTESYTAKEKGQASDSFKRACFNWGIGRELYTAPLIWIDKKYVNIVNYKGKYTIDKKERFEVKEIEYEEGAIKNIVIVNQYGKQVFSSKSSYKSEKVIDNGKRTENTSGSLDFRKMSKGELMNYVKANDKYSFANQYMASKNLSFISDIDKEKLIEISLAIESRKNG